MKYLSRLIVFSSTLSLASNALAASGAREDSSNMFVWIFLGMCALIIVMQLIPAVFMILGFAKGVRKGSELEIAAETADK
jgi:hypothetical protein